MPKKGLLNEETLRQIREGQRIMYEGLRNALWPLPVQTWEEHCEMMAGIREGRIIPIEDDEEEEHSAGE